MQTVGFIGLGRMGSAMAWNIQMAGYPMVVYDVRPQAGEALVDKGARHAGSPAELARLSDVVFTSLPGPEQVEAIATGPSGILEGIKEGGIYADLSTCGPDLLRGIEPMFRQKGAHVLDAPVLSSPALAAERILTVMVGGDREAYERVHEVMDTFADQVIYAGGLGAGCVCKLINNMMEIAVWQIVAEGLTLGVKAGVEVQTLMESGSRGLLGSRSAGLAETVLRGEFEPPTFTLELARKDIGLAIDMGRNHNVPLPVVNLLEKLMMHGMNRGWANRDYTVTFLLQEEMAAAEVRAGAGMKMPQPEGDRGIG